MGESVHLTDFLWWVFCALGLIYFVTESTFFRPFRTRIAALSGFTAALIYCPACSGFWLGILLGIWAGWPEPHVSFALESGLAAMGLGALWGAYHFNQAWTVEQERGHDYEETSEDGAS